jgi:hypothetical protein
MMLGQQNIKKYNRDNLGVKRKQNCSVLQFLGAFRKISKAAIGLAISVRNGRIFMEFNIGYFFRKSVEKIQVSLKSDKNNGHFT